MLEVGSREVRFSHKVNIMRMGLSIIYLKGSNVEISKKKASVHEDSIYLSRSAEEAPWS